MTYHTALRSHFWFSLFCLALSTAVIFFTFTKHHSTLFRATAATILISYLIVAEPFRATLLLGQVNHLLLCLMTLFWVLQRQQRNTLAGICLGIAVVLKTYPILLLVYLLPTKNYRIIGSTLVTVFLFTVTAALTLPNGLWHDWFTRFGSLGRYLNTIEGFSVAYIWNDSINGFFIKLHTIPGIANRIGKPLLTAMAYAFSISLLLVSLVITTKLYRKNSTLFLLHYFPLALLTMYLISPWSWSHHISYLLPALIALPIALWQHTAQKIVWLIVALAYAVLALPVTITLDPVPWTDALLEFAKKFYALIVLWCLLSVYAYQTTRNAINNRNNHE